MSKFRIIMATLLAVALAAPALAADVKISGDLNNRFMLYTNQANMYSGAETISKAGGVISDDKVDEFWGDIKYRLQAEAATNDGKVKGVYAIELGAIRFGQSARGGGYSGDGVNIETRFAYTDFAVSDTTRVKIGLQPFKVNHYIWQETATGVSLQSKLGAADLTLAWMRGNEAFNTTKDDKLFEDADALLIRGDLKPAEGTKLGVFALYERSHSDDNGAATINYELKRVNNIDYDLYTLGVDGGLTAGTLFVNWDAMYQTGDGEADGVDFDQSGYFLHADVGVNLGAIRLTYTGWYASGDDDDTDSDIDNFIATDVDMFDSVVLFEGGYTDDNYFTEAPYILNKGMIFNKLAADFKANDKLSAGAALLYMMTAEDLPNGEDKLGTELDAYVSYKLYPNVEVAVNAGYLFADDGMDAFEVVGEQDGNSDSNIYRSTMRVRYSF